jgi:DNA-binding transcriptional LysR family regulator
VRLHPRVTPDVQLEDRIGNWVEDRVDVGFRAGHAPEEGVIARRLLPLQLVVCATPGYIARHGAPATPDDLARHRCSGFRQANTGKVVPWEFRVDGGIVARTVPAAFATNDVDLEARAVLSGEFIGQLLGSTAAPLVRAGLLVPLLADHASEHLALYLYYGSRVAQPARVRAFIDLAVARLADNPALFLQPHELRPAPAKRRRRAK